MELIKKYMKHLFLLLFLFTQKGFSQILKIYETKSISAQEVIINNYSSINFKENLNKFDIHNPYTTLVFLTDEKENTSHILYQTDFEENILYFGISNNILERFICKTSPMFKLNACIKEARNSTFSFSAINNIVNCIVDRINNCNFP
jgi:hypothetical protein